MILTSENIFNNANLTPVDKTLKDVIKSATMTYWEQEVDISLYAINDFMELRQEHLAKNLNFFTTRMKTDNNSAIIIRLNDEFVGGFLSLALDNNSKSFALDTLTPLETRILNSFSEFLYKKLIETLAPSKSEKMPKNEGFSPVSKDINILYFIKAKNAKRTAKLMLTLPKSFLPFETVKKAASFADSDFVTSSTFVTVKVGTSKITLKDLRELQAEDIILLEDSELTKATLISGSYQQKFNVKINPSLIIHLDDETENEGDNSENNFKNMTNEVNMEKNLWDDIEVEIGAEFEKVKMSIGELKQLTQGQVVDLGSIFESEISMYVENKKVATGELLIINDRYAVKLNKVLSNPKARTTPANTQAPAQAQNAAKPAATQKAPQAKPAATAPRGAAAPKPQQVPPQVKKPVQEQKEDFDYSDFEK